jgi:hypothetical protein
MDKIATKIVHYSDPHPLETTGGVQTFARNLRLIFEEVEYMTPKSKDVERVVQERIPVICDNQYVLHWPESYPVIGFQHGVGQVKYETIKTPRRWLTARAQRRAAARPNVLWVANSQWVAETFKRLYGNRVDHVIYYPIDVQRFDGRLENQGSKLILHDARTKHKGKTPVAQLTEAFGDWQIEFLNCDNSQVHERMRRARAFIHLSTYEGNSVVCNEAMAMNLPCMFTRVGLMQDENRPEDVFVVDVKDVFSGRGKLFARFREFLATLDQRSYNPRAWTMSNATLEIAIERWKEAIRDYGKMAGREYAA